jgi:hypothetical protein
MVNTGTDLGAKRNRKMRDPAFSYTIGMDRKQTFFISLTGEAASAFRQE